MTAAAKILAVDDTSDVLTLLVRILRKEGYQVHAVDSGEAALGQIGEAAPDLILLDVRMVGLSGLDVCRKLKARDDTRTIPIILMSGYADIGQWVDGLHLGAVDYITKPFEPEELRSRVKTHLALRHARQTVEQQARILQETNRRLHAEILVRQDIELELRASLVEADRARTALLSVLEDRQVAEQELRRSEEEFRGLFEASRDAIMILEPPNWLFTSVNPVTLAIFKVDCASELVGHSPIDLSPELQPDGRRSELAAKEQIESALRDGIASFEWTHQRPNGEVFAASVVLVQMEQSVGTRIQATVRDISEHKRLESELGHARKLEAVGQLAAGIAHEINTPAQYVGDGLSFLRDAFQGYRNLLREYQSRVAEFVRLNTSCATAFAALPEFENATDLEYLDENVPDAIERCMDGVSRVATIVRAMKEFAHPDEREMAAADLNRALRNTLVIARNEYKYVADVETDFGDLPPVMCHLGDINQVFLNLIVNAAQAIGVAVTSSGRKGSIRLRTQCDGDWVRIEIADSGGGVPEAIRHRIFDPFFTTKPVGQGSGQGLAIARAIVVGKHHGALSFETEMGRGTTFTVRLPVKFKSGSP